jgi:ferrochelatase
MAKTGVLLVNLGTPDSPSVPDVRKYLREFLMDERVIDIPFLNRWLLVNLIIAPFRAPKSAKIYQEVWLPSGSPLKVYGLSNERVLGEELGSEYVVRLAMRYQNPGIPSVLAEMEKMNLKKIIVIPFFPQYASATSGSVHQKVMETVKTWQNIPEIVFAGDFYKHPLLVQGFADNAAKFLQNNSYEHYVFSYHGLPERQTVKAHHGKTCKELGCEEGITEQNYTCYKAQCFETTRLLAEKLGLTKDSYTTCFQSRLGKEVWIQPYTEDVVKELAGKGIKKVLAFSPAFVADCLETTIEVGEEYKEMFIELGGEQWDLVESLNDTPIWIELLKDLVKTYDQPAVFR